MLMYLNGGPRRYDLRPVQMRQPRRFWEFQAVLAGTIAPVYPEGVGEARSDCLWLFPLGSPHGWTSPRGVKSEIAVFHFPHVPAALARRVADRPFITRPLDSSQRERVRALYRQAYDYSARPGAGLLLSSEHLLAELSLLAYEGLSEPDSAHDHTRWQRVKNALAWYEARMAENPGLIEVAAAVHVSPAHLRRLFHHCLQASPKAVFDQLREQRALQLLAEGENKLAAIAESCGFSEVSAFSRAFKRRFGTPPSSFANKPSSLPRIGTPQPPPTP